MPNSISTVELLAVFKDLLISYSLFGSTVNDPPLASLKGSKVIVLVDGLTLLTTPVPAIFSSFLKSIWNIYTEKTGKFLLKIITGKKMKILHQINKCII